MRQITAIIITLIFLIITMKIGFGVNSSAYNKQASKHQTPTTIHHRNSIS